jgi:decaprenyl-phosphate phosphoribosyltransferase
MRSPAAEAARVAERAQVQARARSFQGWLYAVIRTARPRQWPKNLLVFAAPLAGATLGRHDGLAYAIAAAFVFGFASVAVYFVNDVVDAERDRCHPTKRTRPVAAGELPAAHAIALAVVCVVAALGIGFGIGEPLLVAATGGYLVMSFLYSLVLKHLPVVELVFVASGFLLRVLGGAAATHVRPSVWFLVVCGLGAFLVAVAKRYTELAALGPAAARHRPSMRWYSKDMLRAVQYTAAAGMIATYLMWAIGGDYSAWTRGWHLASALPLALALVRFSWLTARTTARPVEDLIMRDLPMFGCELAWLLMFATGLY